MTDNRLIELSRRKILAGLGTVGAASAGAGLGTTALFSDEESVEDNTITAGTTNLIVEAGVASVSDGLDDNGTVEIVDATNDGDGDDDTLTVDGTPDPALGLTVGDMLPGDSFVIRVTVDVRNNPMYVSAVLPGTDSVSDSEGDNPEPEPMPGPDDNDDALPGGGDLDNRLQVTFGYDDDRTSLHDNGLEGNIEPESGFDGSSSAIATDFLAALDSGFLYRGRQGASGSPPGGHADSGAPTRIGGDASESNVDREKVTHFIEFALPAGVGNEVMGDSYSFDLRFQAEQVRNNSDPFGTGGPTTTLVIPDQTANPP